MRHVGTSMAVIPREADRDVFALGARARKGERPGQLDRSSSLTWVGGCGTRKGMALRASAQLPVSGHWVGGLSRQGAAGSS